jgi:hypothetical protein
MRERKGGNAWGGRVVVQLDRTPVAREILGSAGEKPDRRDDAGKYGGAVGIERTLWVVTVGNDLRFRASNVVIYCEYSAR